MSPASTAEPGWLAEQFEHWRPHVTSVAYGMLGLARPVWVNGAAGALFGTPGDPVSVLSFTVAGGRVAELGMVSDPAKLRHLAVELPPGSGAGQYCGEAGHGRADRP